MKKLFFYIIFCYLLVSCQSSDIIKNVEFDYSEFKKLTFLSNSIEIKNEYKISLEDSLLITQWKQVHLKDLLIG